MKLSVNDEVERQDDMKFLGVVIDSEQLGETCGCSQKEVFWWLGNLEEVEKHPSSKPKIRTFQCADKTPSRLLFSVLAEVQ